jgi:hypothetical protein
MKTIILAAVAVLGLSTAVMSDATGSLEIFVVSEGSDAVYTFGGDAHLSFNVLDDIEALIGGEFAFTDGFGTALEITKWYIGARVDSDIYFTLGNQGDLWIDGMARELSATTLSTPVSGEYSVIVGRDSDDFAIAALTGYDIDSEEFTNAQVVVSLGTPLLVVTTVTAVLDYNITSGDVGFGVAAEGSVSFLNTMGALTYVDDVFAYEAGVGVASITGWLAGDQEELFQFVGAGYEFKVGEINIWTEATYNIKATDTAVGAGVVLSF